jgi:hypothetical protein
MQTKNFSMYSTKLKKVECSGFFAGGQMTEVTVVLNDSDNENVRIRMDRNQVQKLYDALGEQLIADKKYSYGNKE